jgi:DNA invertase Pin-like site-specific DNA recombinase
VRCKSAAASSRCRKSRIVSACSAIRSRRDAASPGSPRRPRPFTRGCRRADRRRELLATAERRGWNVVAEFADEGISGAKGRDKRPAFDKLLKAVTRRKIDMVAAWSVDRLGRSLQDLVGFLGELHAAGVDLYLERQGVDTSTPAGRALFQMLGVFAEFERALIQERIRAGIAKARENGTKSGRPFGRPTIDDDRRREIEALLREGIGIRRVARMTGSGNGVVARIKLEIAIEA